MDLVGSDNAIKTIQFLHSVIEVLEYYIDSIVRLNERMDIGLMEL